VGKRLVFQNRAHLTSYTALCSIANENVSD
jgi:hypothetical protein